MDKVTDAIPEIPSTTGIDNSDSNSIEISSGEDRAGENDRSSDDDT